MGHRSRFHGDGSATSLSAAAHLDVGTVYSALERFTSDNDAIKILIIFGIPAPPTPDKTTSIACEVKIVRSIDQSR